MSASESQSLALLSEAVDLAEPTTTATQPAPVAALPAPVVTAAKITSISKLSTLSPTRTKGSGGRLVHFGVTLAEMLRNGEHSDIMRFSPAGDAVWILDRKQLSEQVMPEFGMKPNWDSFVRQLRYYGFHYASERRSIKFIDVYVHATFDRDNTVIPVRMDVKESMGALWHKRAQQARRNAPGMRHMAPKTTKTTETTNPKP